MPRSERAEPPDEAKRSLLLRVGGGGLLEGLCVDHLINQRQGAS